MRELLLRVFALAVITAFAQAPRAGRINRAIELLSQGQAIYYPGPHSGTEASFEQEKKMRKRGQTISATTWSTPPDIKGLAEYMQGLAAEGPTKTGHRTPPVIDTSKTSMK